MTDRWDAARSASRRSIRKQTLHKSVIGDDKNNLHEVSILGRTFATRIDLPTCQGCGYKQCACDTNRKFDGRPLIVGDVCSGILSKNENPAHYNQTIVITKLDVAHEYERGKPPLLGAEYVSKWTDAPKWFRYGYLRESFKPTGISACVRHKVMWDTREETHPKSCVHCGEEIALAKECIRTGDFEPFKYEFPVVAIHEHGQTADVPGEMFRIIPAPDEPVMGFNSVSRGLHEPDRSPGYPLFINKNTFEDLQREMKDFAMHEKYVEWREKYRAASTRVAENYRRQQAALNHPPGCFCTTCLETR